LWQNDKYFLFIKLRLMQILSLLKTFNILAWLSINYKLYSQNCIPYHDTVKKWFQSSKKLPYAVTLRYNYKTFILASILCVPSILLKWILMSLFYPGILIIRNIWWHTMQKTRYKYLKHLIPDWLTLPNSSIWGWKTS